MEPGLPSSGLGLSQPFSRQRVCLSPSTGGGGGARSSLACGWGAGAAQFRRLEKKLSTLPSLWGRLFTKLQRLSFYVSAALTDWRKYCKYNTRDLMNCSFFTRYFCFVSRHFPRNEFLCFFTVSILCIRVLCTITGNSQWNYGLTHQGNLYY